MDKYIMVILDSKKVRDFIRRLCLKQGRIDLQEDLLYWCIEEFIEKDINELLLKIKTNSSIEAYFIGMIYNQINSNTSSFYKHFRNCGFTHKVIIDSSDTINTFEYQELDVEKHLEYNDEIQLRLDLINSAILRCDPMKVDMFKMMYIQDKSYKEISEFYNIRIESVEYRIKSVKKEIKKILNGNN